MKRYMPAKGAPLLRTTQGEAYPETGKMIEPAVRYYARLIKEGALVPVPDEAGPDDAPETETRKPAANAAPKKEPRT